MSTGNTFIKTIDNSSVLQNAISLAIQPLATMSYVAGYVSVAIQNLATSSSVTTSIANALTPYSTTTATNTSIANALTPYSTTTAVNTAIASSSLIPLSNIWTGSNTFRGVCNAIQSADTILPISFSPTPSFSMTTGMVYYLSTSSTSLTSLGFTNIPTTPQQTYVFSFVLLPTTLSSPWYLKPPTNFISVTPIGGSLITVPVYGISTVVFPTSYTYIVQTITIVNTSPTTTPSFVSFLSVSGY